MTAYMISEVTVTDKKKFESYGVTWQIRGRWAPNTAQDRSRLVPSPKC